MYILFQSRFEEIVNDRKYEGRIWQNIRYLFMNDKRALCVKNEQDIVGVLLYSRKHNMICCLAVDPAYRKRGIASMLLSEALDKLDRDKDIIVSTFRENDVKGIAPRNLYKKFGFEEDELIEK